MFNCTASHGVEAYPKTTDLPDLEKATGETNMQVQVSQVCFIRPLLFALSTHTESTNAVKVFGGELRIVEDPQRRSLPLQDL